MEIPQKSITLKSITLTNAEAATRQIEAATEALSHDGFDIGITLAGAAEGIIVNPKSLFDYQRNHPKVSGLAFILSQNATCPVFRDKPTQIRVFSSILGKLLLNPLPRTWSEVPTVVIASALKLLRTLQ